MEQVLRETIHNNNLFTGLSVTQIDRLMPLIQIESFKADELIIREGDPASNLFIIAQGEVEVLKKDAATQQEYRISTLTNGAVVGEIALIDSTPRSASIRALTDTTVFAIAISDLQALINHSADALVIYDIIITNLAREVSKRLRDTDDTMVKSLANELHLEQTRGLIGRLIINIIIMISFYTFALSIITRLTNIVESTTIIGAPIVSILVCATYFFIKKNKVPISFYGLTWIGWRKALFEGLLFTLPVLALMVLAKYIAIKTVPEFAHLSLFDLNPAINHGLSGTRHSWLLILFPLIYLLFVPAQELVFRGVLQGSLADFLTGPYKTWLAILMADFIFSMTHLHVGLGLALLAFLPGIFWGWLYSRHHTLLGVTVSHILIGGFAFFVLGINAFLHL